MPFQIGHLFGKRFQEGQFPWNKGLKTGLVPRTAFEKGLIPWNKGKTGYSTSRKGQIHTDQTKEKISKARKGKNLGNKQGFQKGQVAYKINFTAAIRRKMSEARKGKYSKSYYANMGTASTIKNNHRKTPTSIEVKLYEELKNRGLLFETQKLINGKFVVDAYIPSLNLVIEADGDYWHSLPENKARDRSKNGYLKVSGYNLLRVSETEINNGEFINKFQKCIINSAN